MSLQVCHCGWSKKTTYHGLRTHQGIKGCTPKGMHIPPSQQYNYWPGITGVLPPVKTEDPIVFKPYYMSGASDFGLTTQQRMMGDILKTSSMQVTEDFLSGLQIEPLHQTYTPVTAVKEEDVLVFPNLHAQNDNSPAAELFTPLFQLKKNSSQMGTNWGRSSQMSVFLPEFSTITTQVNPPSPQPTVQDGRQSFFETPQHLHQTTSKSHKSRRGLDFSTEDQQVDPSRKPPTSTDQEPAVRPKDTEKKKNQDEKLQKAKQDQMKADLRQKINNRKQRMEEVRSSSADFQGHLDAEWQQINSVFSDVVKLVQDARQKVLQPLEDRKREVERETEILVQKIQREIDTFEKAVGDLNNNQVSSVISLDESENTKEKTIDTSVSFGTLRVATSTMINHIQQELEKLTPIELKRIPSFAVHVTLDPATAHQSLYVSPDGKKVRDGGSNTGVPNTAERFDVFGSILGLNSLTSGRAYWEVDVGYKSGWDLGVARRSAKRKGQLVLNPDKGYWVAVHYEDRMYAAMTAPPVRICPKEKPMKVGVFVDYEEGLVSFYDVRNRSHIYSFTECQFGGEIRPYFSPHPQSEKNRDPLFICAV